MRSKLTWCFAIGSACMIGFGSALLAADTVPADANPYSIIGVRNVFHLNDPPPPAPPPEEKPVDLPKVMLCAFVGKGSSMKVCLAIPQKDNKNEPVHFANLLPGQREDNVELVSIRYHDESVDIINSGTPQTLTAKNNSFASAAAPAAKPGGGGPPGIPGMPGRHPGMPGFPTPGQPPGGAPVGAASAGAFSTGPSVIMPGSANANPLASVLGASPNSAFVSGGTGYAPAATATPANNNNVGSQIANTLFNGQNNRYQPPTPTGPTLPPDVQAAAMIVQKAQWHGGGPPLPPNLQEAVDGMDAPPPPTPP